MVTRERSGSLKEGFPLHLSYEINVRIAYFFVAVAHNIINVLLRQANASRSSHWCTASRTRSVQGNNVDATIVASMQIFGPTDWTRKKIQTIKRVKQKPILQLICLIHQNMIRL